MAKIHNLNQLPKIKYGQSTFKTRPRFDFTANVGDLIPFMCEEVYPGDRFKIRSDKQIRMLTLQEPIFDDLVCDFYYFFCPMRLVWENFTAFFGENKTGVYDDMPSYSVPQITAPEGGWAVGTIADYLDVPPNVSGISISALPFRAVALTINQWFISQNLDNPCNVNFDDDGIVGSNGSNYVEDIVKGGMPFVANKLPDYFTRCLPEPQKGDPVLLPLGSTAPLGTQTDMYNFRTIGSSPVSARLGSSGVNGALAGVHQVGLVGDGTTRGSGLMKLKTAQDGDGSLYGYGIDSTNIVADLSLATSASINDLRLAFQMQKYLEKDSRYGTRYIEFLHSHFGVISSDKTLQRVEYLGGGRFQLNVNQVLQTTNTAGSPLGATGAYSNTIFHSNDIHHSFEEHGFLLGFCVVRYKHSYSQGLKKMFTRKNKLDFYDPLFSHIGEQAVLNKEIFVQGNDTDNEVFGYMEAWAELREIPSRSRGYMRPNVSENLSIWNLTDNYSELPTLSSSWLKESKTNVDRVLATESSISVQLLFNFWFDIDMTRSMPLYSVPGLIDHF